MTEKKCQKKCSLDQDNFTCSGCGRTIEEIKHAGRNALKSTQAEDDEEGKAT